MLMLTQPSLYAANFPSHQGTSLTLAWLGLSGAYFFVWIYFLSVVYIHSYRSYKLYLTRNIPSIWFHHSRDHEISSTIAAGNIICTSKNLASEGHHKTDYKIHTTNISHHSYLPGPAEVISSADIDRNLLTEKPSLDSWYLILNSWFLILDSEQW